MYVLYSVQLPDHGLPVYLDRQAVQVCLHRSELETDWTLDVGRIPPPPHPPRLPPLENTHHGLLRGDAGWGGGVPSPWVNRQILVQKAWVRYSTNLVRLAWFDGWLITEVLIRFLCRFHHITTNPAPRLSLLAKLHGQDADHGRSSSVVLYAWSILLYFTHDSYITYVWPDIHICSFLCTTTPLCNVVHVYKCTVVQ